jgi:hypothetical protein
MSSNEKMASAASASRARRDSKLRDVKDERAFEAKLGGHISNVCSDV